MGTTISIDESFDSNEDDIRDSYNKEYNNTIMKVMLEDSKEQIEKFNRISSNNKIYSKFFNRHFDSEKKRLSNKEIKECLEPVYKLWKLRFIVENRIDLSKNSEQIEFLSNLKNEKTLPMKCKEYAYEFFDSLFDDINYS